MNIIKISPHVVYSCPITWHNCIAPSVILRKLGMRLHLHTH